MQTQQDPHASAHGHQCSTQPGGDRRDNSRKPKDAQNCHACQTAQKRAQHYQEYEGRT